MAASAASQPDHRQGVHHDSVEPPEEQPPAWPPLERGAPTLTAGPSGPPSAAQVSPPPAPRRGPPTWRGVAAAALGAALVAGTLGGALGVALTEDEHPSTSARGSPQATGPSDRIAMSGSAALDVGAILAKVQPAVVTIRTGSARGGAGTGIILRPNGEVLTNAHVVEGASSVRVVLPGQDQARQARVVGADATEDLALVQVEGASGLTAAELGRSADVRVGDDVVAIGNALGLRGSPTVTRGIVSALNRSVSSLTGLIQTDAAINPGNSGGPLVNGAGHVVGINTASAGARGGQNIGFAIPVDRAAAVIERLRRGERAPAVGYLGVASSDADDGGAGAQVREVEPGSPAAAAGLQPGDVIVTVGGQPVNGSGELAAAMRQRRPGDQVEIGYRRGGETRSTRATLAARPSR